MAFSSAVVVAMAPAGWRGWWAWCLQPDVGHEVLWVVREVLSGQVLLARPLLSSTVEDLAALLREATAPLGVPVVGVVSDGQETIRTAAARVLPDAPHQLCHFHYFKHAALPIYEADRHAKKELKKCVRGSGMGAARDTDAGFPASGLSARRTLPAGARLRRQRQGRASIAEGSAGRRCA